LKQIFKEASMAAARRRLAVIVVLFGLVVGSAFAQDAAPAFAFKMDLGLGVSSFTETDTFTGSPTTTYQSLSLSPDFSFGNFGIGLSLTLNYRFAGPNSTFTVRQEDWVPNPFTFQNFLSIYLAKISYIRWGHKGDDLFIKLGSFNDATLGDGFIVGDYSNMLFLPGDRHFGFQADLDGNLFKFPYIGLESVIGNVARADVLGARVYVRPLASLQIPIISNLELGAIVAADTDPYFGVAASTLTTLGAPPTASPVVVFGGDIRLPIVNVEDTFSLVAFSDVASLQVKTWGGMLGVGGRLINIFTYGAQLRLLDENFIPTYFGPTYDLLRAQQYMVVQSPVLTTPPLFGWLASIGTSFLDDRLIFRITLDGPFAAPASDPSGGLLSYPHLRGTLSLAEGVVPGITFDFSYDKKAIIYWSDLVSAQDAAIQAQVNFKTGPAVISFVYKIVYDPTQTPDPWAVTSGLQTSISLF
jgi:hypothetical protein